MFDMFLLPIYTSSVNKVVLSMVAAINGFKTLLPSCLDRGVSMFPVFVILLWRQMGSNGKLYKVLVSIKDAW